VFGLPQDGGLIDAGCGTGHQAIALAQAGYTVTGADLSAEMLALAQEHAGSVGADRVRFIQATYEELQAQVGGGHDGLYCLGNALAAAGSRDGVATAMSQFSICLRPGGRLFLQILNFKPLVEEVPCVRGPRMSSADGVEYVSVREFHRDGERLQVTNISLWREGDAWAKRANCGYLYPITPDEMRGWLTANELDLDDLWGGYDRRPFDIETSVDLIVVATRH
jgi:SAM-dependent methyltransferase